MNPANYVEIQRIVNGTHLDGRVENAIEEATYHVGTLARWLKSYDLPAESFLDAGCRTGYAMEALAQHFPSAEVTGIDIVPEFVQIADLRGTAVEGDMQEMPFEDEQFDWTFSCTSIEHAPDTNAAVEEMRRVSKYGFYVHTDLEDKATAALNSSHHTYHETPEEWIDVFRHPEWFLCYLHVPRYNRVELIMIRKRFRTLLKDAPWR